MITGFPAVSFSISVCLSILECPRFSRKEPVMQKCRCPLRRFLLRFIDVYLFAASIFVANRDIAETKTLNAWIFLNNDLNNPPVHRGAQNFGNMGVSVACTF